MLAFPVITLLVCSTGIVNVEAIAVQEHARLGAHETSVSTKVTKDTHIYLESPVDKIVTMLQQLEAEVSFEDQDAKKLYDDFMCDCKTTIDKLSKSVSAARDKLFTLAASIKAVTAKKTQLKSEIESARESYQKAKKAIEEAMAIREQEKKTFRKNEAELTKNLAALRGAIPAVEKGLGLGSFLQSAAGATLRDLSVSLDMSADDRDVLTGFLADGSSQGSPGTDRILGILRQMHDSMKADLESQTKGEIEADAAYENLFASKMKEKKTLLKSIEVKYQQLSALPTDDGGYQDLKDAFAVDQSYLRSVSWKCNKRRRDYEAAKKAQTELHTAITESIKMLDSPAARELFRKTDPYASYSFVQMQVSTRKLRHRTLQELRRSRHRAGRSADHGDDPRLDLLAIAVQGGTVGFGKIMKMIDELVDSLKKEQRDADSKLAWCATELNTAEDNKRVNTNSVESSQQSIANKKTSLDNLKAEIATLLEGLRQLNSEVTKQTVQRHKEHLAFSKKSYENSEATRLLSWAKGKLAAARGYSASSALVQVNVTHSASGPETVIYMLDHLIRDLSADSKMMQSEEEDMQAAHDKFIQESSIKLAADAKLVADKQTAEGEAETDLLTSKKNLKTAKKELIQLQEYIHSLHLQCDSLMQNADVRKEARDDEIENLKKAKLVLSGADYELVETGSKQRRLRGAHDAH